jgi:hypothetical protein
MFKLKQKTKTAGLSLALAAAMTGGVMMGTSTSVQAINIAQDGLGEVLIFPYYTTRNGWQSYFNITNTSSKTTIIKVRWHEGVNSRDARDFVVTLSPYDVWTAAVIPDPDGEGARIVTSDSSCTAPALTHDASDRGDVVKGVDFTNLAFSGSDNDSGSESLDRTKEGYFTVFAMGAAKNELVPTAVNAKHVTVDGHNNKAIPFDCNAISNTFISGGASAVAVDFNEPNNTLRGRAILINAATGISMGYDPTVLANFYNPSTVLDGNEGLDVTNIKNIVRGPSTDEPNLDFAKPSSASWIDDTPGIGPKLQTVSASEAASNGIGNGRSVDAVSVLFNRAAVVNDYNVAGDSATDWVITLPTKRYYVDEQDSVFAAGKSENVFPAPLQPFDSRVSAEEFGEGRNLGESCFDVTMRIWDREEGELTAAGKLDFSPKPPPGEANKFCYETNLISFGKAKEAGVSNVMGSVLSKSFENLAGDYGWAQLEFGKNGGESLPIIGLRLETRKKAGNSAASYGFANTHSYKRDSSAY